MSRITGSYPGGPSRGDADDPESGRPRRRGLRGAEDLEERLHAKYRSAVGRKRRKRLLIAFGVAVLVAGATGFWMGLQAHRSADEIASEQERRPEAEFDITRERNLLLQQLWLMEDLERVPRR